MQTPDSITGGCQCGHIRYRITGEIIRVVVCHCTLCQQQSGSAFGLSLIISEESFELTSGKLKTFEALADSGRVKTCAFCPECGVRIYNQSTAYRSIKAGTLDDRSWLRPSAHIWTRSKQPWVVLPDDIPCFEVDG